MINNNQETCKTAFGCLGASSGGPCYLDAYVTDQTSHIGLADDIHKISREGFEEFLLRIEAKTRAYCVKPDESLKAIARARKIASEKL